MSSFEWLDKLKKWKNMWPLYLEEYKDDASGLNLYTFIEIMNKKMTSKETVVCDAGSAIYVPSQNLKMKEGQRFILSGAQADMGFALPASIGVYLADSSKNVLVFTGDGSFNTNIQELATIRNLNIPIKIFIWNNSGYLSIKNTQIKFYEGRIFGTSSGNGLWFPEIKNIAQAYEFSYYSIKTNQDLEDFADEIINNEAPTLIEVICQPNQEIVPTLMLKKDLKTGYNIQCGLHDMYPFLDEEILSEEMINEKIN
jgi:acetolactate synthase-1/2/3 large subunit